MKNQLILAQNQYYSMDCYATQLNNNVLVVGSSGTGKTRSIVSPNILQATDSYIVTDPKGRLYDQYKDYLIEKGYEVKRLDFTNPKQSEHYNFFRYINDTQDILKIAHMLIYQRRNYVNSKDPFWDEAAELLLQSLIGFLIEARPAHEQNYHYITRLIDACEIEEDHAARKNALDHIMEEHEKRYPQSYAAKQYNKFRVAASRTLKSILISLNARIGRYDTPELNEMMSKDDIDIASISKKKTALFVVVSDTDRSLDGLVNVFFTQAMNELCRFADRECKNGELPVPVRFIMDDFATNCTIEDFPRMISSIRSRRISVMLMIQAESQLTECFGYDGKTIIANCDTYIYLGGNDVDTAKEVAVRCDVPLKKILYMPIGMNYIFRRGQEPVFSKNFVLEDYFEVVAAEQEKEGDSDDERD